MTEKQEQPNPSLASPPCSPICLYHRSDLDGHCSGAIVSHFKPDAKLIGVEYGDEFLNDEVFDVCRDADVILTDFSLQPWGQMQRLALEARSLRWIDHHRTAIDEYETKGWAGHGPTMTHLDTKKAACELTWAALTVDPLPRPVYLLGRYDVWDLDAHADILPFQMGMRLFDTRPDGDFPWQEYFALDADGFPCASVADVVSTGLDILKYQEQCNDRLMGIAFDHTWKGLRFLAINASGINSKAFESRYDPAQHDAVLSYFWHGKQRKWTVSLYSPDQRYAKDDTLCGIAKDMGGGGHPCACGFQVDTLERIFPANNLDEAPAGLPPSPS